MVQVRTITISKVFAVREQSRQILYFLKENIPFPHLPATMTAHRTIQIKAYLPTRYFLRNDRINGYNQNLC